MHAPFHYINTPFKLELVTDRVHTSVAQKYLYWYECPTVISKLIYTPEIDHQSLHHLALAPETPESALVHTIAEPLSSPLPTSSSAPPSLYLTLVSYDGAGVVVDSENELFTTGVERPYRRRREIHW